MQTSGKSLSSSQGLWQSPRSNQATVPSLC